MFKPHEQALLDALTAYFDRVIPLGAPVEPSLQILVRTLAAVLATDMAARGLTETALPQVVSPYQQQLETWTREALDHLEAARWQG
jgi:hypothetical protein